MNAISTSNQCVPTGGASRPGRHFGWGRHCFAGGGILREKLKSA